MRFFVYIGLYLVLSLYIGVNAFLAWNRTPLEIPWPWFAVVFAIFSLSYLLARVKVFPKFLRLFLKVIGSYYFAAFEFALILVPVGNLIALVFFLFGVQSPLLTQVLGDAVIIVLLLILLVGSWFAWVPKVRRYELNVHKILDGRESVRILAASDIHLGNLVGNRHLRKLVRIAKDIQPSLILLPGDVLDGDMEPFVRNNMGATLKELNALCDVYAVLGNHEYYDGQVAAYVREMESLGIKVLQDEVVLTSLGLYIAGRKDKTAESPRYGGGRMAWSDLLAGIELTRPIVAMDHQPLSLSEAQTAGADVLLCGHTHRGQFAPNHWITRKLFELDWGYLLKGTLHVLVSSGFGTWGPPIRLASQAEVLDIHLTFH